MPDLSVPSHFSILRRAWPIILANSSVPLLGLTDTAVLGNFGTVTDLGAIALGALIFSFLYWSFGFLRMGTTGFIAQADGAGDEPELRAVLGRSLLIALALGILLTALQKPITRVAFGLLSGSDEIESIAATYLTVRIWAAPATLATFAFMGALIGLGDSRKVLVLQLLLNGLNITLDIWFAGVLGLGAAGIATGTLIAEWLACAVAAAMLLGELRKRQQAGGDRESFWVRQRILDRRKLMSTLAANRDIMIRTLLMIFSFAWFINHSARYGDVVLAANHLLMELISFAAFFLDGFAFVAEAVVGQAKGASNLRVFDLAVRKTSELSLITALLLALGLWLAGTALIDGLTDMPPVRLQAQSMLVFASLYVLLSFAAFQLDGVFIGTTSTPAMRNAAVISTAVYLLAWWLLAGTYGITGLWIAFIIYVCARALALLWYYPALRRGIAPQEIT